MKTILITAEVAGVLRRSLISNGKLFLPRERLDRSTYEAVNAAIEAIGGQWSRREKAHIFSEDPATRLRVALDSGHIDVDLETAAPKLQEQIRKERYQAFYTPPELAEFLASLADVRGCDVLEPSIGGASLARACRRNGASVVDGVEIDPGPAERCRAEGFGVVVADFLALPHLREGYDRVVMNPPFSRHQDVAHVEHALGCLNPRGKVVAVMPRSLARPQFQRLLAERPHQIHDLPPRSFRESGTDVHTIALEIGLSANDIRKIYNR